MPHGKDALEENQNFATAQSKSHRKKKEWEKSIDIERKKIFVRRM